jgi:tetratricopeptide (TPR) repeat protein
MDVDALIERARDRLRSGDFEEARRLYGDIVSRAPEHATATHERGICSFRLGEHAAALEDYTRSIALEPGEARFYQNRGVLFEEEEAWERAIADFDRCLDLGSPEPAETFNSRGCAHAGNGDIERAFADWNRATEIDPGLWKPYHNRALSFEQRGDHEAQVAELTRGLAAAPHAALFSDRARWHLTLRSFRGVSTRAHFLRHAQKPPLWRVGEDVINERKTPTPEGPMRLGTKRTPELQSVTCALQVLDLLGRAAADGPRVTRRRRADVLVVATASARRARLQRVSPRISSSDWGVALVAVAGAFKDRRDLGAGGDGGLVPGLGDGGRCSSGSPASSVGRTEPGQIRDGRRSVEVAP